MIEGGSSLTGTVPNGTVNDFSRDRKLQLKVILAPCACEGLRSRVKTSKERQPR